MNNFLLGLFTLIMMAMLTPAAQAKEDNLSPSANANGYSETTILDLNTASIEQLTTLPGVGISKAKAIVKYREEIGPFLEVEQLTQVKGIGTKMLTKIKTLVRVEPQ